MRGELIHERYLSVGARELRADMLAAAAATAAANNNNNNINNVELPPLPADLKDHNAPTQPCVSCCSTISSTTNRFAFVVFDFFFFTQSRLFHHHVRRLRSFCTTPSAPFTLRAKRRPMYVPPSAIDL